MSSVREDLLKNRNQIGIFIGISLLMLVFTTILVFSTPAYFQRFIGSLNPLLVLCILAPVGLLIMTYSLTRNWFTVFERKNTGGFLRTCIIALVLALIMIGVDLYSPFPEDMNVPVPYAFLFYPVIAYAVEILFHLIPLIFLMLVIFHIFGVENREKIVWFSIIITSLLEPVYQMSFGASIAQPMWQVGYTGINVFAVNFMELYNFKKHDFVSMLSFRLVYYLFWHIIWGFLRLSILY